MVNAVGPEWHSMRGGRIEARIQLDVRLAAARRVDPHSMPRAVGSA